MTGPNNCIGGSEQGCPANGEHTFSITDGQQLGKGPDYYNNMSAPNNVVGGAEGGVSLPWRSFPFFLSLPLSLPPPLSLSSSLSLTPTLSLSLARSLLTSDEVCLRGRKS